MVSSSAHLKRDKRRVRRDLRTRSKTNGLENDNDNDNELDENEPAGSAVSDDDDEEADLVELEDIRQPFRMIPQAGESDQSSNNIGAVSTKPPPAQTTTDWLYEYLIGQTKFEKTNELASPPSPPTASGVRTAPETGRQQEEQQQQCLCPPGM